MRKILKFLFIFIITLVLLISASLVGLYFIISDDNDNAPTELYTEEISMAGEVDNLFSRFLINYDDSFYLAFTEEDLNRLFFAFFRNLNPDYYSGCSSDECNYILSEEIPKDIPIIGGDSLHVKHGYTKIVGKSINFYLVLDIPYLKTNLNFGFDFEEALGTYILTLNKLGLGGLNLMSGLGKTISRPILLALGLTEASINQMILKQGLPLDFNLDDYSFSFKKEDLGELIKKLIGDEASERELLNEFIDILSSADNELLQLGFFEVEKEDYFGFKIDLNQVKTDSELSNQLAHQRELASQGFDVNSFILNKTQTFIIGSLSEESNQKLTFTNQDFNRIIYDETSGYSDFKFSLLEGEEPNFELTGIFFNFTLENLSFNFVIEVNGVEVLIQIIGKIESSSDNKELIILLQDEMSIGGINASSEFVYKILDDFELDTLNYDSENHSFKITTETFNNFMEIGGSNTPLVVEEIKAINGGIEVYVNYLDPSLNLIIENAKDAVENLLQTDFLNEDVFIVDDLEQAEIISQLTDALDEISDILQDPEQNLSTEDTDNLIGLINNLSDENQEILLDQITENANSDDLEDLYNQLFGN